MPYSKKPVCLLCNKICKNARGLAKHTSSMHRDVAAEPDEDFVNVRLAGLEPDHPSGVDIASVSIAAVTRALLAQRSRIDAQISHLEEIFDSFKDSPELARLLKG